MKGREGGEKEGEKGHLQPKEQLTTLKIEQSVHKKTNSRVKKKVIRKECNTW